MNDCQGLASYVATIADPLSYLDPATAAKKLDTAMVILTPSLDVSGVRVPLPPSVSSTSSSGGLVNFNDYSQPNGYLPEYQDGFGSGANSSQISTADQGHHFAAFFQLGFVYGASVGASSASFLEMLQGSASNQGDINLGIVAARIGDYVHRGILSVDQVADALVSGKALYPASQVTEHQWVR